MHAEKIRLEYAAEKKHKFAYFHDLLLLLLLCCCVVVLLLSLVLLLYLVMCGWDHLWRVNFLQIKEKKSAHARYFVAFQSRPPILKFGIARREGGFGSASTSVVHS